MDENKRPITILMADDDEDDRMLTRYACEENQLANNLNFVQDGEELIDYLKHRGEYADQKPSPRPGLILLDLNMPKKDGREALKEIKADPILRRIPVVVLTTSNAEQDVRSTYDLGANSFITKPATFESLVDLVEVLVKYWFDIVELPPAGNGG